MPVVACLGPAAILSVLLFAGAVHADAQGRPSVSLQPHTYQTVRTPPFNGQLAFYAADIPSTGTAVTLPITVQILIGNGRRPFAVDTGSMRPQEFETYIAQLKNTGAVRVLPFRIQKMGERVTFQYLSRSVSVTAADLIPCKGCPGRVVLTVD